MSRSDFYTIVHKHVRRVLFDTSVKFGSVDRTNVAATVAAFRGIAGMLGGHAAHEEESLGPVLREAAPNLAADLLASHHALDAQVVAIEKQMQRLIASDSDFEAVALDVYRAFNFFLADDLKHLDDEETRLFPALKERNPKASGVAMIVVENGQPTPVLAALLPILTQAERAEILRPLCADETVENRVLTIASGALHTEQIGALERALGPE